MYNNISGYGVTVASTDLKSIAERHAGSNPAIRTNTSPGGEMVDTLALGASAERRGGSSPSQGTRPIDNQMNNSQDQDLDSTAEPFAQRRIAICRSCQHYTMYICSQCGCFMPAKTRLAGSSCPIGLWTQEKN